MHSGGHMDALTRFSLTLSDTLCKHFNFLDNMFPLSYCLMVKSTVKSAKNLNKIKIIFGRFVQLCK